MTKNKKIFLLIFSVAIVSIASYLAHHYYFGTIFIKQQELDFVLNNMDQLYASIRVVPNFENGKSHGLKILNLKKDSFFYKLKLRKGDIILTINGMDLRLEEGIQIFERLKGENNIFLGISRNGKLKDLKYQIID